MGKKFDISQNLNFLWPLLTNPYLPSRLLVRCLHCMPGGRTIFRISTPRLELRWE